MLTMTATRKPKFFLSTAQGLTFKAMTKYKILTVTILVDF